MVAKKPHAHALCRARAAIALYLGLPRDLGTKSYLQDLPFPLPAHSLQIIEHHLAEGGYKQWAEWFNEYRTLRETPSVALARKNSRFFLLPMAPSSGVMHTPVTMERPLSIEQLCRDLTIGRKEIERQRTIQHAP